MRSAARAVRSSKREVIMIDGEESSRDQPAVKSVKIEEGEEPVPNVVELQQKVLKLENNFQRACRAARTAELRAEAAERKLESKYGIKDDFLAEKKRADELETRLAEVSTQLEEAKRRAESAERRKMKTKQLVKENETLKTKMEVMETVWQHLDNLVDQRDEERQRARDSQAKDRARIDELKQKVAQYEKTLLKMLASPPGPEGDETDAANTQVLHEELELHETGHPTNIFQLCRPDSSESTPLHFARKQLVSVVDKAEGSSLYKKVIKCFEGLPQNDCLREAHCEACNLTYTHYDAVYHFLSKGHYEKVASLGAAVSSAALKYWLDMLQQQGAAPVASTEVSGASKDDIIFD